ncbi:MAG: MEDS domain-containing protein [Nitrosarchaeum sp.]
MNVPLRFVNSLDTNKHVLLFYSDPEYAKRIEFQFIGNGLAKGEHCVYATEEDPAFIKEKMKEHGIKVRDFLDTGLLHIYQTSDPFSHPEGLLAGAKSNFKMILKDSKPPYRMIAMLIPDTGTTEAMGAHIKVEKEFHDSFASFNGSMMCPYNIRKLEQNKSGDWIRELLQCHHSAIYAPSSGEGGVFNLDYELKEFPTNHNESLS